MRRVEVNCREIGETGLAESGVAKSNPFRSQIADLAQLHPQHAAPDPKAFLEFGKLETGRALPLIGRQRGGQNARVDWGFLEPNYGKLDIMRHLLFVAIAFSATAAPANDEKLLPPTNLLDSRTVPDHVLGPSLPSGGVLGHYKDKKGAYELVVIRQPDNQKAAFFLLDVKKAMTDAHYLANFGGFAGKKEGKPFFVFAKGPFIAAIAGKPEVEAEPLARVFAARLPLS